VRCRWGGTAAGDRVQGGPEDAFQQGGGPRDLHPTRRGVDRDDLNPQPGQRGGDQCDVLRCGPVPGSQGIGGQHPGERNRVEVYCPAPAQHQGGLHPGAGGQGRRCGAQLGGRGPLAAGQRAQRDVRETLVINHAPGVLLPTVRMPSRIEP
jgi:hypothetical protein